MDELVGYYGEKLVLLAQMLGLNTCWVAMTFSKRATKGKCEIRKGEKLVCVLALGYGTNQGITHKIKDIKDVCKAVSYTHLDVYKRQVLKIIQFISSLLFWVSQYFIFLMPLNRKLQ